MCGSCGGSSGEFVGSGSSCVVVVVVSLLLVIVMMMMMGVLVVMMFVVFEETVAPDILRLHYSFSDVSDELVVKEYCKSLEICVEQK